MRTSFYHQPEAQHPKSPAIYTPAGRLPHLRVNRCRAVAGQNPDLSVVGPIGDKIRRGWFVRYVPKAGSCAAANGTATRSPRRRGRIARYCVLIILANCSRNCGLS